MDNRWPDALPRAGNRRLEQLGSVSPWFAVYRVSAGTFALVEPRHFEEAISYLVLGAMRAALIDTGMGIANIRAEVERLTDLPVTVVNTHSHYDHVGGDHRFLEVWALDDEHEIARIEGGLGRAECARYLAPGFYLDLPPDFDPATYEIRPAAVTRRLHHLDGIELGGRTLTVHHTPGHSPGSICLLDSRDGLLFTGDTYYPGTMYVHLDGADFEAYVRSVGYLLTLLERVSHLCPAHNEAYAPKEVLARVSDAFGRIVAGQVAAEAQGETRVYRFEGFGVAL